MKGLHLQELLHHRRGERGNRHVSVSHTARSALAEEGAHDRSARLRPDAARERQGTELMDLALEPRDRRTITAVQEALSQPGETDAEGTDPGAQE